MGRVMTPLKLTNNTDLDKANEGLIAPAVVRTLTVEALVDTGATILMLPAEVAAHLGLPVAGQRRVRLATGRIETVSWVRGVNLEILGRDMTCDALVGPEGSTPLIGQIQLEALDLVVDPKSRDLRVNPESPDMPLLDLLAAG